MNAPLLEFDDFKLHFDTFDGCYQALDGVTLSVAPGEALGIVGETGCGKSVTAKSVLGLVPSPPRAWRAATCAIAAAACWAWMKPPCAASVAWRSR